MLRGLVDLPVVEIGEYDAVALDDRDLPIVEEHDLACVCEDRGNIGGHEELAVAEADDDRRAVADGDDRSGIVRRNQDEGEQPFDVRERATHRGRQAVAAALLLDEVGDDFRVGLGDERVPGRLQLALELQVVLDDPVVHDDDAVLAVAVRMRILFRGTAVRCPARVSDAEFALDGITLEHLLEIGELAGAAPNLQLAVADERDARRVVPAICEATQPIHQHGQHWFGTDVTDDAAHVQRVSFGACFGAGRRALRAATQPGLFS